MRNGLLIASPQLGDAFFDRTVILLCEHSSEGSMGIVINRPLNITLDGVFDKLELPRAKNTGQSVLWGGPIREDAGFIILQEDLSLESDKNILKITQEIYISSSINVLQKAALGEIEKPYYLCLGHAGWISGQLDEEIKNGTWIATELDLKLLFDIPYEKRWEYAISSLGLIDASQLWMKTPIFE